MAEEMRRYTGQCFAPARPHFMRLLTQIDATLIRESITKAVQNVFKTMYRQNTAMIPEPPPEPPDAPPVPVRMPGAQVVGMVGFIGDAQGLIYLYLPAEFALLVTTRLSGMGRKELEANGGAMVNDAVGEMTNMTVGNFKKALCDLGFSCRLTIPSVLRGSNFCITPVGRVTRHVFYFECAGHRMATDILINNDD